MRRWSHGEGYVLVQVALIALVFFGPRATFGAAYPFPLRVLGGLLLAAGAAILIAALLQLGRQLTPLPFPKTGGILVTAGPYAIVRHPMYSAGVLAAIGWALAVGGRLTFLYALMLFAFADVKSRREERWLCERFPEYTAYCAKVRRLIPWLY